jgi:hypothetical protein
MLGPGGEKLTGRIVRALDAAAAPRCRTTPSDAPIDYNMYLSLDYKSKL